MSDQDDDSANAGTDSGQQDAGQQDAGKTFSQADLDRIVADRVARERAKYSDYGDLKKKAAAAMTDQERAVAAARTEGATEAARAAAPRLVRAELRAAAAEAGVPKDTLAGFLEYADLTRFTGDDGEVDDKAISAAIKKLGGGRPASFDGGARTTAPAGNDMNSLIRRAAGVS